MTYRFSDWQAGTPPPKGWDAADAVDDGWTKADLDAFMRATVKPWSPPEPEKPAGKPAERPEPVDGASMPPKPSGAKVEARTTEQAGVDAIDLLPRIFDVHYGSEVELAELLAGQLATCGNVVFAEGSFWVYGPTEWREVPMEKLELAVHKFNGASVPKGTPVKVGQRMVKGVIGCLSSILSARGHFDSPTVGVNALNGVILVERDGRVCVRPHDPDDRFRYTVQAEFHLHTEMHPPEGTLLHKLIYGAFAGEPDAEDKVNLVGEMLGAAAFGLATRLPQPKAFVFLGETASNGKSTIAGLLACLLPAGSVSSIPPAAFGDERRIINLAGKAANVADELSAAAISGETFKAAVTGDPIEGRDVYRSAVTFVPRALHCFTTNTLPRFSGGLDRGLQRRLVVVRFNRPIPEKEIIPDIADRIQQEELDLLLGFAIAGAQRLMRNQKYTIPASSTDALKDWLLFDPFNEWFEARIEMTKEKPFDGWPRTVHLHEDFRRWATEQGYAERFLPPVNTFGQRLKAMPGVELRRNEGARAYWISLKAGRNDPEW